MDANPVKAWSHSALSQFETCPKRYWHLNVAKDVREEKSEAQDWGSAVHAAFQKRFQKGTPFPLGMRQFEPLIAPLLKLPGTPVVEQKLALDVDFQPSAWFGPRVWVRAVIDAAFIRGNRALLIDWKGLALDTELPTPTGWTTMGAVRVGDKLFDDWGQPTTVVGKSQVKELPCWELTFDDRSKILCDNEHLWAMADGGVLTASQIRSRLSGKVKPRISTTLPLDLPDAELPVDPYVLGLWLSDGKHSSGEISKPDDFIFEEAARRGYPVDMATGGKGCPSRTLKGLRTQLREAGLLGNKHIPDVYFRASKRQREELLQGLMDGDGYANATRKQANFTTTDQRRAEQVAELGASLGLRPSIHTVVSRGFGLTVEAYHVNMRPQGGVHVFRLPRKEQIARGFSLRSLRSVTRQVVAVEQVPTVPTQCIMVDSPNHTFLCTRRYIPTHNTGRRSEDDDQLALSAGVMFAQMAELETIDSAFCWLQERPHEAFVRTTFTRGDVPAIWERFLKRVAVYQEAHRMTNFPPQPGPFCRRFCPVKQCPYHGAS